MNNLNDFVNEKLQVNKTDKSVNDENNTKNRYSSDWQWFNNLICNVELEEEQLRGMFFNLNDDEIKVWIKEVQDCYVSTDQEEESTKIKNAVDLARFYYHNPVTE
jgi:hypothetical protein